MGPLHSFQREGPQGSRLHSDPRGFSRRQGGPAGRGGAQRPRDTEGSGSVQGTERVPPACWNAASAADADGISVRSQLRSGRRAFLGCFGGKLRTALAPQACGT